MITHESSSRLTRLRMQMTTFGLGWVSTWSWGWKWVGERRRSWRRRRTLSGSPSKLSPRSHLTSPCPWSTGLPRGGYFTKIVIMAGFWKYSIVEMLKIYQNRSKERKGQSGRVGLCIPPNCKIATPGIALKMVTTLKASIETKVTEKGSGPNKALNAIGVVTESKIKKRRFSCKI